MGNCLEPKNSKVKEPVATGSAGNNQSASQPEQKKPASSAPKSWEIRRQKLNLADYEFKNRTDETLIKPPGSINGEQFVVDGCKNCIIYLCDNTATVIMDDCENCKIFVGPCASRTMKHCQIVAAVQQFRSRDCEDLDIIIFSQTPPIIESSNNMRFGCFKFGYFELQQQFIKGDLNVWNNRWSEVYDFTKKKSTNFSFLPEDINPYDLIPRISALPEGQFSDPSSEEVDLLVPLSTGDRPKLYEEEILFILAPGYENVAEQMIPEINHQDVFYIIKSRSFAVTLDQIKELPSSEQATIKTFAETNKTKIGKDSFLIIHFGGADLNNKLLPLFGRVFPDKKSYHIWTNNKTIAELAKLIFETWREGE